MAALAGRVGAAEAAWLTDLPQAEAEAKSENKLVLLDFTGSDWCEGCIALRKTVFDSPRFQNYAATNVVLMEVDFPDKKKLPEPLKKANDALASKYDVDGYPTIVVLNPAGKEIGRQVGYNGDDAQAFIAALEKIKGHKPAR